MAICKSKNCNNKIWSKGFCLRHSSKKPLSFGKGLNKKSSLFSKKLDKITDNKQEMWKLFKIIWNKNPHRSEVSGKKIYGELSSAYLHHILPKSKYPEACLDEENIVILTLDEHSSVEGDMYKYEEINKRRNLLKIKYNIL